jgi:hypothetical protein
MDLKERTQEIVDGVKRLKSEWVDSDPENTDLAIYLHFYRGDEMVALVQCPVDRDNALVAARIGAVGFCADTMSVAFESFHSTLVTSPVSGKPWKPREMQYVFETDPMASEKGWVHSCITISSHERGGAWTITTLPYRLKRKPPKKKKELVWLDDEELMMDSGESGEGGGVMHEGMQHAMSMPTTLEQLAEVAKKSTKAKNILKTLSEEQRLLQSDLAAHRALLEQKVASSVILYAAPDTERAKWLKERLGEPESS